MNDEQRKQINNYPSTGEMLKHKDAVRICVEMLEEYTDIKSEDIEWICSEFEQKCLIEEPADDLFDALGYEDAFHGSYYMNYMNGKAYSIEFRFDKTIDFRYSDKRTVASNKISIEELKAVVQKCKELGWLGKEEEQ